MNNKVLYIMPVFNKEEFLAKSIESVLNQTHKNISLCIVDDCSTDQSLSIAEAYQSKDNRVSVYKNKKNSGCYRTRNKALFENRNEDWDFFTIHDSDDTSDANRTTFSLKFFLENPLLMGLKSTYTRYDRDGNAQLCRVRKTVDTYASEGIAFFRRPVFDMLGYYDDTRFSGDTEYWWRLEHLVAHNPLMQVSSCLKSMYQAISHEQNLTKIYDFETDRPQYMHACMQDIQTNMVPSQNYYREAVI